MILRELFALVGAYTAIVAATAWIARAVIQQLFSRDLERHKASLNRMTEQFKGELAQRTKEHEIRFSKLHEKRALVIGELHELLAEAEIQYPALAFVLTVNTPQKDNKDLGKDIEAVYDLFDQLQRHIRKNRIYLSRELATTLTSLVEELQAPVVALRMVFEVKWDEPQLKEAQTRLDNTLLKTNTIMKALETEFRSLLGVDTLGPSGTAVPDIKD